MCKYYISFSLLSFSCVRFSFFIQHLKLKNARASTIKRNKSFLKVFQCVYAVFLSSSCLMARRSSPYFDSSSIKDLCKTKHTHTHTHTFIFRSFHFLFLSTFLLSDVVGFSSTILYFYDYHQRKRNYPDRQRNRSEDFLKRKHSSDFRQNQYVL